jgi:hypothetical protein
LPSPSAQPADRCDGRGTDDGAGGCRWFPTTIEGQITDESGAGVPAICVDLNSPLPALSDVTAGDGTYRIVTDAQAIDGLGDVRLRDCSQADPGWADQPRVPIKIVPGTTNRLDAVMIGAAAVNGHVVDVNGAPVAGACVRSVGADDELTNTVRTDDSGYFRITHIRTGDNRAEAQQECPVQYLSSETPFTVGPGETAAVTITVTRPGQVPNS